MMIMQMCLCPAGPTITSPSSACTPSPCSPPPPTRSSTAGSTKIYGNFSMFCIQHCSSVTFFNTALLSPYSTLLFCHPVQHCSSVTPFNTALLSPYSTLLFCHPIQHCSSVTLFNTALLSPLRVLCLGSNS
jgi:hypothetical protein